MLQALLKKIRRKAPREEYSVPEGSLIYAVGDIHGRADLLRGLHQLIARDAQDREAQKKIIVYLGDYVDRGPYVRETLDLLVENALPGFESRFLMGNHEQLLLNFLEDPQVLQTWIFLGGQSTLLSYKVRSPGSGFSPERGEEVRQELIRAIPEKHLEFLNRLEPFYKAGTYLFVHAGIRPSLDLEDQKPEDIYWIRDDFLSCKADHGLKVVHGHTITEKVQVRLNRVGIDTGAYATGVLTCAVFENRGVRFLST